jgi:protein-tyrosine phosphatase
MKKVLFVCLGNICRSPMAEAIFNKLVAERGLEGHFQSDSAGTAGYHIGELPDFRTRKICEENQAPVSHRGRKISKSDLHDFDIILAMDNANYHDIIRQLAVPEELNDKVQLMRSYDGDSTGAEVPDPYYGNMDDFKNVYAMLQSACNGLLDSLQPKSKLSSG